jgi:hypothetical protein
MGEVIKSKPKLGLSIEIGTSEIPNDGRYHVLVEGVVVYSTKVLAAAEAEFDDLVLQKTSSSRSQLAREQVHFALQAIQSESAFQRAARAKKTGGKGGRGGS